MVGSLTILAGCPRSEKTAETPSAAEQTELNIPEVPAPAEAKIDQAEEAAPAAEPATEETAPSDTTDSK